VTLAGIARRCCDGADSDEKSKKDDGELTHGDFSFQSVGYKPGLYLIGRDQAHTGTSFVVLHLGDFTPE
jgi:hypothetical protein